MQALIGAELVRKLPARDVEIRDSRLPGFVLRCRRSGVHSYRFHVARGRWITLGRTDAMTPEEARNAAEAIKGTVSKTAQSLLSDDPHLTLREARSHARADLRRRRTRNLTWTQFLTEHYDSWLQANLKSAAETLRRLRVGFSEFADRPLAEWSVFDVERWRTARLKAGRTAATVNRDLGCLKAAFSRAAQWKLVRTNPLAGIRLSRTDSRRIVRYLDEAEEKRLRAALTARDDRRRQERDSANLWRAERQYQLMPPLGTFADHLTPLVLLAMNTGLRRGELFNLTWRDVDFVQALLTVRGGGSKSGETRFVPLNAEAVETLQASKPLPADPTAYVFVGDDGQPLGNCQSSWEQLLEDARIASFRFHDLRHHFASRLVQAGVDLNTVRELLGHADLKMTLRYAHLAPQVKAEAVAKLVRA